MRKSMRRITLAAPLALAFGLAACSSSGSTAASPPTTAHPATAARTPTKGIETLSAALVGKAAADALNSSSNAGPAFPRGTWTGPVATTVTPLPLGNGGNGPGYATWTTPDGRVTVYHAANDIKGNPSPVWAKAGNACHFTAAFSKGAFSYVPSKSTGLWARVTGTGTYLITAQGNASLNAGKTTCSNNNTGNVLDNSARITFLATAPVTVRA
jgi:hypothetical protein